MNETAIFGVAELAAALARTDPGVLLVSQRILRRVIKRDRRLGGLGLQAPHSTNYVLAAKALLAIASGSELGLPDDRVLPDPVILLPLPDPRALQSQPPAEVLRADWRLLFHARVHQIYAELRAAGKLTAETVRRRAAALGEAEFEEVRAVLAQDGCLLAPDDAVSVFEELAACYLELRCFDQERRTHHFPGVESFEVLDRFLAEDLDAEGLLARTRPEGAANAPAQQGPDADPDELPEPEAPASAPSANPAALSRLAARADQAAGRGNLVRAAILREKLARVPQGPAAGADEVAAHEIGGLVARLRNALVFPEAEADDWARAMQALLEPAARGFWTVEARLLYDLQKVCVDQERELYAADLVEFFVSWFRRPVQRPLPLLPAVLTVKHLRSAAHRLTRAHLPNDLRRRLAELLHAAEAQAEARLRRQVRPHLLGALDAVGLVPRDVPEQVAREKLADELLDLVAERGFLSVGDLRDAIARNQLKLPDLTDPVRFFTGDPLLCANRLLARDLDGIYRRGEIYLRWLQRLSSLAFGNPLGRFLTNYLALPFGGAFFLLKGIDGLSDELHHFVGLPALHIYHPFSLVAVAYVLFGLLYVPTFRRELWTALTYIWQGVRGLLYDLPAAVLRLPAVRRLVQSRAAYVIVQFVCKPLLVAAPVALALYFARAGPALTLVATAAVFAAVNVFLNSRLGMYLEEVWTDRLVRSWQLIRDDLVPGLFRWVLYVFRRLLEAVERLLYGVDELLRFRAGQGRLTFAAKVLLGLFWFLITYVVRFVVNLLIEPQINPIKHFPVVTVSHKLMLLLVEPLARKVGPLLGLTHRKAIAAVTTVLGLIPGLFGFLVWELKENRRLYRANVSLVLEPEMVGSHGETVLRLLRPGFHAGTIPKLFAKLRHAHGRAARKALEGLHHVEEAVRHFVQRELVALLEQSPSWGMPGFPTVGRPRLATNRIQVELACPGLGCKSVVLSFEHRAGWLVAGVARSGWLAALDDSQARTLTDGLAGFYHLAGVDVVREQVETALPPRADYQITPAGLLANGALYDLREPAARPAGTPVQEILPKQLVFNRTAVRWSDWVVRWDRDRAGLGPGEGILPGVRLLPTLNTPRNLSEPEA
jgi:hypothetical protein